jgi:glycine/D-amino acid oxidase-like deaminating enzyme
MGRSSIGCVIVLFGLVGPLADAAERAPRTTEVDKIEQIARDLVGERPGPREIHRLEKAIQPWVDQHGRAEPELATALQRVDKKIGDRFDRPTMRTFQGILGKLGVKVAKGRKLELPLRRKPIWLDGEQPLAGFRSTKTLPKKARLVIVGAGIAGVNVARRAAEIAREQGIEGDIVVLDKGDPGNEASGHNGGSFQPLPENFLGLFQGLPEERFKLDRKLYPKADETSLRAQAQREAEALIRLIDKNYKAIAAYDAEKEFDFNYSPTGWLKLAGSKVEEQGLRDEAAFANKVVGMKSEFLSPEEIKRRTGIDNEFAGRLTPGGSYHPFRYVTGVLKSAIDRGVKLYTRTPVSAPIFERGGKQIVVTPDGEIEADQVIVAANAFTREVLPEMDMIEPWQSQIMLTTHAPVRYPYVVTGAQGDYYTHYRNDEHRYDDPKLAEETVGRLTQRSIKIEGGGLDRPFKNPHHARISPKVYGIQLANRDHFSPELKGQPGAALHTGPMANVYDRLPALGEVRPGVFVAFACMGYGGSFATAGPRAVADMALTGQAPEWFPQEIFSPQRLLKDREAK